MCFKLSLYWPWMRACSYVLFCVHSTFVPPHYFVSTAACPSSRSQRQRFSLGAMSEIARTGTTRPTLAKLSVLSRNCCEHAIECTVLIQQKNACADVMIWLLYSQHHQQDHHGPLPTSLCLVKLIQSGALRCTMQSGFLYGMCI